MTYPANADAPLILAITIHEAAHGYIAKRLGDNTAYLLGRVTLNPLKHIDLVGTLLIPLALILLNSGFLIEDAHWTSFLDASIDCSIDPSLIERYEGLSPS